MSFIVSNKGEDLHSQALAISTKAELLEVRTFLLHAEVVDLPAAEELQDIDGMAMNLGVGHDGESLSYTFKFDFTIKGKGDVNALKFQVHLGVLFSFPAEDEVSEESAIAFGRTVAQLAVHPYLRSAVSDLAVRLGFPGVTLGLLKLDCQ